jgi:hypothetical protein
MSHHDFTAEIHARAQHVANHLNALTPYERSLVLHEAQAIWDERAANRAGEALDQVEADNEATEIAATAAWIGARLHTLSPQTRAELVQLIEGLSNDARLERLMEDDL